MKVILVGGPRNQEVKTVTEGLRRLEFYNRPVLGRNLTTAIYEQTPAVMDGYQVYKFIGERQESDYIKSRVIPERKPK